MRIVAAVLFHVCSALAETTFGVQSVTHPPFARVDVWGPPRGAGGRFEVVVLLHGNQLHAPDPTWMMGLRFVPGFERRILVVPSLPDGQYDWSRTDVVHALGALLAEVARTWPVDRMYLVGYSAGGSRVLEAARARPGKWAGLVSIAGDVLRSSRALGPSVRERLLLVCMTGDDGPHTSCRLNESNRRLLRKRGFAVALSRVPGDHNLDLARIGPVLDGWMKGGPAP